MLRPGPVAGPVPATLVAATEAAAEAAAAALAGLPGLVGDAEVAVTSRHRVVTTTSVDAWRVLGTDRPRLIALFDTHGELWGSALVTTDGLELGRSAFREFANIVISAWIGALVAAVPGSGSFSRDASLPSPPRLASAPIDRCIDLVLHAQDDPGLLRLSHTRLMSPGQTGDILWAPSQPTLRRFEAADFRVDDTDVHHAVGRAAGTAVEVDG